MKFKYKFSKTVYVFFALAYLAAAGCLVWNAIRFVGFVKEGIEIPLFDYISFALCVILPIAAVGVITAAIVDSHYAVKDGYIVVRFGFLTEKMPVSEAVSIVKNVRYGRLTVVFSDESAYRIVIDEKSFDDFSSAIIKINRTVSYGETDEEDAKKK